MTPNLLIGNLISLCATVFTFKSSWAKDTWHIYIYQVLQCLLVAVASLFFNSYAGIVTLLVCALRNYLAANGKLTKGWMLLCLVLILSFGIPLNNRGWVGLVVISANALYTIGSYLARRELTIKLNIALNLLLWFLYGVLIRDIPSSISDGTGFCITVASLVRLLREGRARISPTSES